MLTQVSQRPATRLASRQGARSVNVVCSAQNTPASNATRGLLAAGAAIALSMGPAEPAHAIWQYIPYGEQLKAAIIKDNSPQAVDASKRVVEAPSLPVEKYDIKMQLTAEPEEVEEEEAAPLVIKASAAPALAVDGEEEKPKVASSPVEDEPVAVVAREAPSSEEVVEVVEVVADSAEPEVVQAVVVAKEEADDGSAVEVVEVVEIVEVAPEAEEPVSKVAVTEAAEEPAAPAVAKAAEPEPEEAAPAVAEAPAPEGDAEPSAVVAAEEPVAAPPAAVAEAPTPDSKKVASKVASVATKAAAKVSTLSAPKASAAAPEAEEAAPEPKPVAQIKEVAKPVEVAVEVEEVWEAAPVSVVAVKAEAQGTEAKAMEQEAVPQALEIAA